MVYWLGGYSPNKDNLILEWYPPMKKLRVYQSRVGIRFFFFSEVIVLTEWVVMVWLVLHLFIKTILGWWSWWSNSSLWQLDAARLLALLIVDSSKSMAMMASETELWNKTGWPWNRLRRHRPSQKHIVGYIRYIPWLSYDCPCLPPCPHVSRCRIWLF